MISFGFSWGFGQCQKYPRSEGMCANSDDKTGIYIPTLPTPQEVDMLSFGCNESADEFNTLGILFLSPSESAIKTLVHFPGQFQIGPLMVFMIPYIFLTCITNGLNVPGSVFIPSLLFGSAGGRAVGELIVQLVGPCGHADAGTYAMLGSA